MIPIRRAAFTIAPQKTLPSCAYCVVAFVHCNGVRTDGSTERTVPVCMSMKHRSQGFLTIPWRNAARPITLPVVAGTPAIGITAPNQCRRVIATTRRCHHIGIIARGYERRATSSPIG